MHFDQVEAGSCDSGHSIVVPLFDEGENVRLWPSAFAASKRATPNRTAVVTTASTDGT